MINMANDWFRRKYLENLYKHVDVIITAQIITTLMFLVLRKIVLASFTIGFSKVKCNEHDSEELTENIMPIGFLQEQKDVQVPSFLRTI